MKKSVMCLLSVAVILILELIFGTNNKSAVDIVFGYNYFLGISVWYWDILLIMITFLALFFVYKEEKDEQDA